MAIFDDICPLDENGMCQRHKIKHEGRHHALSQEKSTVGSSYRKQWDTDFSGKVNFSDICPLDENDYCSRHKVKHEGQSRDWSQDQTMIGWKCRKAWDALTANPPPPTKSCNCGKPKGRLK